MKLIRYGARSAKKIPCVLDKDGAPRDLRTLVDDIGPSTVGDQLIERISAHGIENLPVADVRGLRIAPPLAQPNNIWCIGLNFSDHAAEAGLPVPTEPILFNKSSGTYCGPNDDILFSPKMSKLDWEVELGIIIGKRALNVSPEQALDHIFGFVTVNDVSERAWQLEREGQWVKGKSFPNFCPVGPYLVTQDSIPDINNLDMWLEVNGQRKQDGSTSTMIFDVASIVSYMSEFCELLPGDLINTGTPPGVGAGMSPPQWLKIGDEVTLGISELGEQTQKVVPL